MFEGMENNLKVVAVKPLTDTYVAIVTHITTPPTPKKEKKLITPAVYMKSCLATSKCCKICRSVEV